MSTPYKKYTYMYKITFILLFPVLLYIDEIVDAVCKYVYLYHDDDDDAMQAKVNIN